MILKIKKVHPDAVIPTYAKSGDACMDLTAVGIFSDDYGNYCYNTGLSFEIPDGWEIEIRPRSSNTKKDLVMLNSPATIDSGYRGEVVLKFRPLHHGILVNTYSIGDRIAQMKVNKVEEVIIKEVEELNESERGDGGFGSTGS